MESWQEQTAMQTAKALAAALSTLPAIARAWTGPATGKTSKDLVKVFLQALDENEMRDEFVECVFVIEDA